VIEPAARVKPISVPNVCVYTPSLPLLSSDDFDMFSLTLTGLGFVDHVGRGYGEARRNGELR
jgi:hypothetical protein